MFFKIILALEKFSLVSLVWYVEQQRYCILEINDLWNLSACEKFTVSYNPFEKIHLKKYQFGKKKKKLHTL